MFGTTPDYWVFARASSLRSGRGAAVVFQAWDNASPFYVSRNKIKRVHYPAPNPQIPDPAQVPFPADGMDGDTQVLGQLLLCKQSR